MHRIKMLLCLHFSMLNRDICDWHAMGCGYLQPWRFYLCCWYLQQREYVRNGKMYFLQTIIAAGARDKIGSVFTGFTVIREVRILIKRHIAIATQFLQSYKFGFGWLMVIWLFNKCKNAGFPTFSDALYLQIAGAWFEQLSDGHRIAWGYIG